MVVPQDLSGTSSDASVACSESEVTSDRKLEKLQLPKRPVTSVTFSNLQKSYSQDSIEDFQSYPLLHQRLGNLLNRKLHTDVIFLVGPGKEPVEAHRIILVSASCTFENLLFFSDKNHTASATTPPPCLVNSDKIVIEEPNYLPQAFKYFIKALYTNELPESLSLSDSFELFNVSKKYRVFFLEEKVVSHILEIISIQNVFEALKLSTNSIELTKMVPICWKIIEEETNAVLVEHLEQIDEHTLSKVLRRDQLNAAEVELFQFVVRWGGIQCRKQGLKSTGKNKRQQIDKLLHHIRFSSISIIEINDVVIPSRVLDPKEISTLLSRDFSPGSSGNGGSKLIRSSKSTAFLLNPRPRFKPKISKPDPLSNATLSTQYFSKVYPFDDGDGNYHASADEEFRENLLKPRKLKSRKSLRSLTSVRRKALRNYR